MRITVWSLSGFKVFGPQSPPVCDESFNDQLGKVVGPSPHVAVVARAAERNKLDRLFRYISHSTVSKKRPSSKPNGNLRNQHSLALQRISFARSDILRPEHSGSGNVSGRLRAN